MPPKGVSDSPYKKYAIRRAMQEEGISSNAASAASNTSTISSRINTLNSKVDQVISLLQQIADNQ